MTDSTVDQMLTTLHDHGWRISLTSARHGSWVGKLLGQTTVDCDVRIAESIQETVAALYSIAQAKPTSRMRAD